jgi:hypothetical protein
VRIHKVTKTVVVKARTNYPQIDWVIALLRFLFEVIKTVFDYRDKRKARRDRGGPPASS